MSAKPARMRQLHHGPQRHVPEVRHLRRHDGVQPAIHALSFVDLVVLKRPMISRYCHCEVQMAFTLVNPEVGFTSDVIKDPNRFVGRSILIKIPLRL